MAAAVLGPLPAACAVSPWEFIRAGGGAGWGELNDRAAEQQQQVRSVALQRAQKFRPADIPPEQTSRAAADAPRARLDGAHD